MTDFRAALKPRSGPKPGFEIKTSTPAKVDFKSLLNKKDGSTKTPAATAPPSSEPSDFRSVLNKKQTPEAEKNKTTANENQKTKPGPNIPQDKQSGINGVNGGKGDIKANMLNKTTTEKKMSGADAEPTDNKEKTNDGGIPENNNKKTVNGEKKGEGRPPVFSKPLCDVTVVDGQRLRLECQVTSDPKPVITWIFDGKLVKPSKCIQLSQEGEICSLTVDKALPEDEGHYTCRAETVDGKAECSCVVTVDEPSDPSEDKKNRKNSSSAPATETHLLECVEDENPTPVAPAGSAAPVFSSVIQDVEVVEGSAARFDCKVEGYPDPEVVWYKDDQPIKETRHFQIGYEEDGHCSLVISEVCPDDDAKYTCKAVNNLGEASCTAELMVEFMQEEEEEGDGEGDEEEQE